MNTSYCGPRWLPLLIALCLFALLGTLIACDQASQPATINNIGRAGPTDTPTILPADATFNAVKLAEEYDNLHGSERKETVIAQTATANALTPTYTPTPPSPTPTYSPPEATPTLRMGILGCSPASPQEYIEEVCWRGVVNGEISFLISGVEGPVHDHNQGYLMVFLHHLMLNTKPQSK